MENLSKGCQQIQQPFCWRRPTKVIHVTSYFPRPMPAFSTVCPLLLCMIIVQRSVVSCNILRDTWLFQSSVALDIVSTKAKIRSPRTWGPEITLSQCTLQFVLRQFPARPGPYIMGLAKYQNLSYNGVEQFRVTTGYAKNDFFTLGLEEISRHTHGVFPHHFYRDLEECLTSSLSTDGYFQH